MAKETERKFLVVNDAYKEMATKVHKIAQGYLSRKPEATVRIRIRDERAFLTIKGITTGFTRNEWEYEIPLSDAREMMTCCEGIVIEKLRYIVDLEGFRWEVDEFKGAHEGLVVAEIELPTENAEFSRPPFIGQEVTADPLYYNSTLSAETKSR